jgi:hypothetical protein
MMVLVTIIFVTLFWYLDQVLPSEFGIRKHPCFCFKRKAKVSDKTVKDHEVKYVPDGFDPENFQEVDQVFKT